MTAPDAPERRTTRWRLAGIGLLALGVTAALYVAGRLHQPDYTFSMFGADPILCRPNTRSCGLTCCYGSRACLSGG